MPSGGRSRNVRVMLHASSPPSTAPRVNVSSQPGVQPGGSSPGRGAVVLFFLCSLAAAPAAHAQTQSSGNGHSDSGISLLVMGLSALLWLVVAGLTVFMTRREIERVHGDHERRMNAMEEKQQDMETRIDGIATAARAESIRIQDKLTMEIGGLHEKVNRVAVGLASVESEVRSNGRTTAAIAHKLNVLPE